MFAIVTLRLALQHGMDTVSISAGKLTESLIYGNISGMKKKASPKNTKKGRPVGSRLDHPHTLECVRLNIAKTGDTANCWRGVVSLSTFSRWKAMHRAKWLETKESGLREHALQVQLASPAILETAMSQLLARLEKDEISDRVLLDVVEYFDRRRKEG